MYMHSISRELTNKADRRNGRKVTTMLHKKIRSKNEVNVALAAAGFLPA
jgi:hypothetical protein